MACRLNSHPIGVIVMPTYDLGCQWFVDAGFSIMPNGVNVDADGTDCK